MTREDASSGRLFSIPGSRYLAPNVDGTLKVSRPHAQTLCPSTGLGAAVGGVRRSFPSQELSTFPRGNETTRLCDLRLGTSVLLTAPCSSEC